MHASFDAPAAFAGRLEAQKAQLQTEEPQYARVVARYGDAAEVMYSSSKLFPDATPSPNARSDKQALRRQHPHPSPAPSLSLHDHTPL